MKEFTTPATVTTVAIINNKRIVVIENGEKRIAVKPICEILGIDYPGEIKKLKSDKIIGSTVSITQVVDDNGEKLELETTHFKYVFGWLFGISTKNKSADNLKMVCYNALYEHCISHAEHVAYRQGEIDERIKVFDVALSEFNIAKGVTEEALRELDKVLKMSYEDYQEHKAQLHLNITD